LAVRHSHYNFNFVPLVTQELDLICGPRLNPHVHPHSEVRPLRIGRADVLWGRLTNHVTAARPNALRGAVALLTIGDLVIAAHPRREATFRWFRVRACERYLRRHMAGLIAEPAYHVAGSPN
jgi:hypothetical protein